MKKSLFGIILFLTMFLMPAVLNAQDGFGFGEGDFGFTGSSGPTLNIGGEVSAELTTFFDDFSSAENIKNARLGDIFSGSLNFDVSNSMAEAVINLKIKPAFDDTGPIEIDEAFVRAFFGPVSVLGGMRKLSWGKADSFGPLDLVNPLDYTDLTKLNSPQSIKIARPMIHGIWSIGAFSRLEAVFVPNFQGHRFAQTGRWVPSQIADLSQLFPLEEYYQDYKPTLEYAQAGLRYTTTLGSSDLGFQYYYGRLNRPRFILGPLGPDIDYNYYQQIGIDFASVLAGFNLRAEAAANITSDLDGKDGAVENPALLWSLGFDRDLFAGINLNLQGTGHLRLLHGELGQNPLTDIEAGTDMSSTRITGILSRKFLRDELELKAIGYWGIEDSDFLFMPAIVWSRNDVSVELSAGFFGGDSNGELGQYKDNNFLSLILTYKF